MTIEAVMLIMKGVKLDWAEIRKIMGKSDFIEGVLGFNVDQLKEKVKQTVIQEYLNNSEWDIEAIYRSSKAAGPLAEWLQSQIRYKDILGQVEPLSNQVKEMESESLSLKKQMEDLGSKINLLENNIQNYQKEYEELIKESENLKQQMESVKVKVEKA